MGCYRPRVRALALLGIASVLAACAGEAAPAPADGPVGRAFGASAEAAAVPRDLLVAIAVVEGGLEIPERADADIDEENEVPAAGPLQLRRGRLDTLRRGAELARASELELRKSPDRALAAGALVLAELGKRTGAGADLASWSEAIAEMSGFADDAHREDYTHRVYGVLARGGRFPARGGETITLAAHAIPPSLTIDVSSKIRTLANAEYPGAEWFPTSCKGKCNTTRSDAKVEFIVIHDTEANWNASVATLQNDPGKSVHYIIGEDGRVGQFVPESTLAWHAGNISFNARSVGIEHVGYATKPFPEAEYVASAKLVTYLAGKYDVPLDRAHIIGHDQIPNGKKIDIDSDPCSLAPEECHDSPNYGGASKHTDPGIWEWAPYMERFGGRAKCNDATDLFQCTHDKTKRYRCTGGEIAVQACVDDCQGATSSRDATCEVKPAVVTPVPTAPDPEPAVADVQADEGCSAHGRRPASHASQTSASTLLVGMIGVLLARLRTRRRASRAP